MKQIKTGGLAIAFAALSLASTHAAQNSNVVGYNRVTVLGNSDAVVSSPFDTGLSSKTLDQIFPVNLSGLSFSNSVGSSAGSRRTEILVPDFAGLGKNKSPDPVKIYYFFNGAWRRQGAAVSINFGPSNLVSAAQFLMIRNKNNTGSLSFMASGEVDPDTVTTAVPTVAVENDLYIATSRPVPLTLDDLQLAGSGGFSNSVGTSAGSRRDELYFFDNAAVGFNKSPDPAKIFYYFNNGWRRQGAAITVDFGPSNVVEAAEGILLQKFQGTAGSANWTSIATY